jgi:hypothetical protein
MEITYDVPSVSAHGLATMRPEMPQRPDQQSPSPTRVAILPRPGHGRLNPFVVTSLRIVFPMSKRDCPMTAKRISANTALR